MLWVAAEAPPPGTVSTGSVWATVGPTQSLGVMLRLSDLSDLERKRESYSNF